MKRDTDPTVEPGPHPHGMVFLSMAAVVLAAISSLVAAAMLRLINWVTNLAFFGQFSTRVSSPADHQLGWWVVLVPVLGGLLIGIMARYGSKAIRGHGIPEAMEQILKNRSRIAARVAILKPVSAAISIGTGGPFGAEGPIIATGGALGSLLGQILSTTANERKVLLASGAAAGMTAIFGTPLAAILLAIELLLFEFNVRSFVPVAVGCAAASGLRIWLFGSEPAFVMTMVEAAPPLALLGFAFLGGFVGLVATGVSRSIYWVEEQFERLPVHWMWWPALGGIAVGVIGWWMPRTLGVGYNNIEDILSNRLPLSIVFSLCLAKFISWAIALGSGTSGGTLAPLLTIGGGLGVLGAGLLQWSFPGAGIEIGVGALIGMAAMFSGASRALLASVVFAFESTQQPHLLPALLAGAAGAFLVSTLLMRDTIMTEKIVRRGVQVPRGYEADVLRHTLISEVMTSVLQTIPKTMTVGELSERIALHDPLVSRHQASLIVNPGNQLAGIITRGDLLRAVAAEQQSLNVLEAGSDSLITVYPDETVHAALIKLWHHQIGRLPVVDRAKPTTVVGYLGRGHILAASFHSAHEEAVREPGWLASGS